MRPHLSVDLSSETLDVNIEPAVNSKTRKVKGIMGKEL